MTTKFAPRPSTVNAVVLFACCGLLGKIIAGLMVDRLLRTALLEKSVIAAMSVPLFLGFAYLIGVQKQWVGRVVQSPIRAVVGSIVMMGALPVGLLTAGFSTLLILRGSDSNDPRVPSWWEVLLNQAELYAILILSGLMIIYVCASAGAIAMRAWPRNVARAGLVATALVVSVTLVIGRVMAPLPQTFKWGEGLFVWTTEGPLLIFVGTLVVCGVMGYWFAEASGKRRTPIGS